MFMYIYIYIVIHRQTVLFYQNSSGWLDRLDSWTWLTEMPIQDSTTQPRENQRKRRKFKRLCITFVFVYIYPLNGYREVDSFEEPCFTLVATITSLATELNPTEAGEHIYCHPHIDCFFLSDLFSAARKARFLMMGLKPGWLKRQSKIRPLSHEETSASKGNLNAYVSQLLFFFIYLLNHVTHTHTHTHIYKIVTWLINIYTLETFFN